LFVAIGAVAVLSILALGSTSSVMQQMRLALHVTRGNESFYAGRAAVEITKIVVTHDETPSLVTLYDLRDRDVAFGGKTLKLRFVDEERLVPLVQAPAEVLGRLPGLDDPGVASNVAADNLTVKEDARFVSGVTPEMYAQFEPYVTVHTVGSVNINTAGPVVLQALGMDEELVEKIREFRAGVDGQEGTIDDAFFETPAAVVSNLQDYEGISEAEVALLEGLVAQGLLGTSSNHVRVEATLVTGDREEPGAKAVVHLPSGNVVAWYDG